MTFVSVKIDGLRHFLGQLAL